MVIGNCETEKLKCISLTHSTRFSGGIILFRLRILVESVRQAMGLPTPPTPHPTTKKGELWLEQYGKCWVILC